MRRPRKPLWNCHMTGHRPMGQIGDDMYFRLDGVRHVGRICRNCKASYFEPKEEDDGKIIRV